MSEGPREVRGELTEFQLRILSVLADERGVHGLRVKVRLEDYYHNAEINHGRLYPNLDQLVDAGLVSKSQEDGRTNSYELTELGYDVVRDQLQWFQDVVGDETLPTETAVADGGAAHRVLDPDEAEEIMADTQADPDADVDADELLDELDGDHQ